MSIRIYGNRSIKTLPGNATRPTPAKVREALFNIWQGRVSGSRWLDLCAGSGAMGAEALCRGASAVVGMEQSNAACRIIQTNWQTVAAPEQTFQVIRGDVTKRLKSLDVPPFDLVYFDPPYAANLYEPVLATLVQKSILAPGATVAAEYTPEFWLPESVHGLELQRTKRYGLTHLALFVLQK
ncbi:16S rRNA (guanine(966)-N(2))-methyltransferase RsmD [Leptolyngbya cf. ectocarpi LEGE 11479]|uniref:16S rRNA (Guanine(966)-N(2))-methyltransferase RsmD n=1 Tax=Leptolyngbya cf. ectocarpi LEGE 11479 TaxID=1828722 RepID=A0A928ZYA6_LEPEC|nr:16S rRNA (guanine(966)-N(2))-methyltransferase RsmD [Leptolyngbya ectocarpi]MBE9069686.1 16S rRNA (guanine(966)-N(2))-methyltransferase RsmD [Leptolyngbya cf. ectocarpi LEGE 11479]